MPAEELINSGGVQICKRDAERKKFLDYGDEAGRFPFSRWVKITNISPKRKRVKTGGCASLATQAPISILKNEKSLGDEGDELTASVYWNERYRSGRYPALLWTDNMAKRSTTPEKSDKTASRPGKQASIAAATPAKSTRKTAAQAVRDFMQAHPHLRNRDIVQALAAQGIVVDDTIPAQIRSRDKKGRPAKPTAANGTNVEASSTEKKTRSEVPSAQEKAAEVRNKAISQPTIFVHSPVHAQFSHDLLAARTHSQAVKNLRILVARLGRIIDIMEVLKDDDWQITLLAQPDGLLFSATHEQARTAAQVRARLEKLSIQPNEIVLVEVE